MEQRSNWRVRGAALLLLATALWYAPWMVAKVNLAAAPIAIPFILANGLVVLCAAITSVNNWRRSIPPERPVPRGAEPAVAVVIPTCGEPVGMVARTARSVLEQDWPRQQLRLIISDDAHSPALARITALLQREHPGATVVYHEPPRQGDPRRRGAAKSGNLNAAVDFITARFADVAFVETRDADDEVGDAAFLRQCIGQLQADPRVAYVQTIKEARVSPGDPFSNNEALYYRGAMLARNAANAVVPCGSGLVWRLDALRDIGGFPTWNVVEDLQSGVEALRRGWRGLYLPIVGVLSQHAPEDIPNVYKQRGVWALDTMRLLFWGSLRGLDLWQRLHFLELGLFYLLSFASTVFLLMPVLSFLWHIYPLATDHLAYAAHFWPFAAALEVFLAALNGRQPYEALWRARQMWLGLAPVYMRACVMALLAGPYRKPAYRVTRKVHRAGWYWRETLVQAGLVVLLAGSLLYGVATTPVLTRLDLGSAFWALFLITVLGGFVRKSWFGVDRGACVRQALTGLTADSRRFLIATRNEAHDLLPTTRAQRRQRAPHVDTAGPTAAVAEPAGRDIQIDIAVLLDAYLAGGGDTRAVQGGPAEAGEG